MRRRFLPTRCNYGLYALFLGLCSVFFLSTSGVVYAGEPASWTQMKADCRRSGGTPVSEYYNDWVSKGGCICPGSSVGSGQATCSGGSSGNSGSGSISQDGTTNMVEGVMKGNSQQVGLGILQNMLQSKPQDRAGGARVDEEQKRRAAEQQRQAEAEELRRQEMTKERILGELKGMESSGELGLKMDSDSGLPLKTGGASVSAAPPTPDMLKPDAEKPIPRSDAYTRGFNDASGCYSQNTTYCAGVRADQQQTCPAEYRAGYYAGDKQRKIVMDEAYRAGQHAGANGELANGASDARADGTCRTEWIQAYNKGHFQGKQNKAQK